MGDEDKPYKEKLENTYKDDLFAPPTGRKAHQILSVCLAEFFGTFYLVLLGCTSFLQYIPALGIMPKPYPTLFEAALGWGFGYGCMYTCMAHISGHFLNPALTVVMVIMGEMSIYRMLIYIVSEIAGCFTGIFLLQVTTCGIGSDFCLVKPTVGLPILNALLYEIWGTFLLAMLFCICHDVRTRSSYDFCPVKFAFSIVPIYVALYKFTGCSLNPARSIGAAVASNDYQFLWVYIAGPFAGAIIAVIVYLTVFNPSIKEPGGEEAPEA